jgi:hypothetical protein
MRLPSLRHEPSTPDRAEPEGLEVWWRDAITQAFAADPVRLARVRQAVLATHRAGAEGRIVRAERRRRLLRPGSRLIVALATGTVLIIASVGFAAAQDGPGQPFYGLRLTIESLTLPPAGTAARFQAQLGLLESRLDEAQEAGQRGDGNAAEAALAAYVAKLGEIVSGGTDPVLDLGALDEVLSRDEIVLTRLAGELPVAAHAGLQRALDRVSRARTVPDGPPVTGPGNGGNPGNGIGPSGGNPGNGIGPSRQNGPGGSSDPGDENGPEPSHARGKT